MPQRRLRLGKPNRKRSRLSKASEILPTWYEMPRARARRCALKTTDRRPLARTTARVTGAFSGTKRENGARAASIRKLYKHELRETQNSGDLGGGSGLRNPETPPCIFRRRPLVRSGRRGGSEVGRRGSLPRPYDQVAQRGTRVGARLYSPWVMRAAGRSPVGDGRTSVARRSLTVVVVVVAWCPGWLGCAADAS